MMLLSSDEGPAAGLRGRRARLTALTNVLFQGSFLATGLISVPLTVSYLGPERYGIWLTLNSLLTWLTLTDLGWGGNALINVLSEAHGRADSRQARELVSTAFFGLALIALIFTLAFVTFAGRLSVSEVFNASSAVPEGELRAALLVALVGFAISFPCGVVQAVLHGYQRGYVANAWNIAGSLLGLVALVLVTRVEGDLARLVLALWGVRAGVSLLALAFLFVWAAPWLAPRPALITGRSLSRLSALGAKYFVAQLAGLGMFHSQPLIVAHLLGPSQVGVFSVAQRVLALPWNFAHMLASPLLPAYGEARARSDWSWIRRAFVRSFLASAATGVVVTVPLAVALAPVLRTWVGPDLVPPEALVTALSTCTVICSLAVPASVLLYGLEAVGGQAIIALVTTASTVLLGLWLTGAWGLAGMGWAMAFAYLLNILGQAIQVRSVLKATAPHD